MKNNKLINLLQDIGLSEKESEVYLSAISLGPTTILKISKESGIKRTTAYSVVESLKEKGLMYIDVGLFKTIYRAEHPEKLSLIIEEKKRKLESISPDLTSLFELRSSGSKISYYEGIESIKNLYLSLLEDVKNGDDYFVITNQKDWFYQDEDFFQSFIEKRSRKKLNLKILMQDSEISKKHKKYEKNYNQEVKILPKDFDFESNIVITPKKLIIHNLGSENSVIVIQNLSAIKSHSELFKLIWNLV